MIRSCALCRQRLAATAPRPTNYSLLSLLEKLERSQQQETPPPEPETRSQTARTPAITSRTPGLSFMDGKSMTLAFRKTGLKVDIK